MKNTTETDKLRERIFALEIAKPTPHFHCKDCGEILKYSELYEKVYIFKKYYPKICSDCKEKRDNRLIALIFMALGAIAFCVLLIIYRTLSIILMR